EPFSILFLFYVLVLVFLVICFSPLIKFVQFLTSMPYRQTSRAPCFRHSLRAPMLWHPQHGPDYAPVDLYYVLLCCIFFVLSLFFYYILNREVSLLANSRK